MSVTRDQNSDMWHVVKSLQAEAGGGVAKAVQITVFFDKNGNLIGKTDVTAVKLMPGGIDELVKMLFRGR